jgi:uncharacterized protein YndB with AHSA1/START domain
MGPVTAEIDIDVSRERAFEEVADIARRPAFTDHMLSGFHLTRIESTGVGAGARFRVGPRLRSIWMDSTIVEVDRPHRIVERGLGGRLNRIPTHTVWELLEGPGGLTKVRVSNWTEPSRLGDRALEALSRAAASQERGWREALRRLRDRLESDAAPARGLALAGGNRHATGIP